MAVLLCTSSRIPRFGRNCRLHIGVGRCSRSRCEAAAANFNRYHIAADHRIEANWSVAIVAATAAEEGPVGAANGAEADSEEEDVNFGAKKKKKKGSSKKANLDDAFASLDLNVQHHPSEPSDGPDQADTVSTGQRIPLCRLFSIVRWCILRMLA